MNIKPSLLGVWTLALALALPLFTAQADEETGYCIEIIGAGGATAAFLELPRNQGVTIRGELGAADEKIAKASDGSLAADSALLILSIESTNGTVKLAFPIANEEWKKKLAVLDHELPHWGQLADDLNTPGRFQVGLPVGILFDNQKLTIFPENSDPLVAALK